MNAWAILAYVAMIELPLACIVAARIADEQRARVQRSRRRYAATLARVCNG